MKLPLLLLVTVLSFSRLDAQHEHHMPAPAPEKKEKVKKANVKKPAAKKKAKSTVLNQKTEHENQLPGKSKVYHLYLTDTLVNYTGKFRHAIAANGSIPMPTLTFTEGDTAEIYVHNLLKTPTSVHWHGVILPNRFDGVPYLTQMPIEPGETHLYKFPVIQNGTYWYHSHSKLQEQIGMYGALIFLKKNEPDIKQYPVVLSDWINEQPYQVHRSLHNATDWYAIKKGSTQNYFQAIKEGYFGTKITNEWKRMLAMDVSDVAYDRFLTNGKVADERPEFKKGDRVKLRIANAGAATYFWLTYAGGKMTVVANDGEDVEPVEVDRLIIAVAETYDIIVTIPENMSYEFLATAEDRSKSTSLWLGSGMKRPASPLPKLKYFEGMKMMNGMMKMNGDLDDMGMNMSNQTMDMNVVMYPEITGMSPQSKSESHSHHEMKGEEMDNMDMGSSDIVTLNYGMLRSPKITTLPPGPVRELHFELTGNMNRFVWSINNKTVSETDKIRIHKGENVRIIMANNTMMRHPMHLHGHFFRVLNGQGDHAPIKNVLDIMPMETDTLEFAGTESGDWFFHCHFLYHMMSGMGRIFSYENSPPNPELPDPEKALRKLFNDDRQFHPMIKAGIESNGTEGEAMLANTRWKLEGMWHLGYHDDHGYEAEINLGRYIGKMQWLYPYIGYDYHYRRPASIERNYFDQISNKDDRKAFVAGFQYTLPMLLIADARIDTDGKIRFQLGREDIPLTNRLRLNLMANSDREYTVGLRYVMTKYFSLSTHYDSDMGWGGGVTLTY
jgi:CopA family copper-resistance protein